MSIVRHLVCGVRSHSTLLLILLACGTLLSCQSGAKQNAAPATTKHYDLMGKVVSVDKTKKEVTVSHDEIVGYMPAMTMPFPVKDDWVFNVLEPGSRIGAKLVVAADGFWLEEVVVSAGGDGSGNSPAPVDPAIGRQTPNFKLVNQDDKPINLDQYRGRVLLLTFIYTRCPLPEYCTLMSTNFSDVNKRLANDPALKDRAHLLSITIDPAYDTPKVLRSYGASHTGNFDREKFAQWEFVTGSMDEIKKVAEFFGLTYFEDKNQINHTLRTAVIAPDGKVYKIYPDNTWKPAEVFADVQTLLGKQGD